MNFGFSRALNHVLELGMNFRFGRALNHVLELRMNFGFGRALNQVAAGTRTWTRSTCDVSRLMFSGTGTMA